MAGFDGKCRLTMTLGAGRCVHATCLSSIFNLQSFDHKTGAYARAFSVLGGSVSGVSQLT